MDQRTRICNYLQTFHLHPIHREFNSDFIVYFYIDLRFLKVCHSLLADTEHHLRDDAIRWHDANDHPACCAGNCHHVLGGQDFDIACVQQQSYSHAGWVACGVYEYGVALCNLFPSRHHYLHLRVRPCAPFVFGCGLFVFTIGARLCMRLLRLRDVLSSVELCFRVSMWGLCRPLDDVCMPQVKRCDGI